MVKRAWFHGSNGVICSKNLQIYLYILPNSLSPSWPSLGENGQPEDDTHLRHVQLQMRIAELKAARELIRSITSTGALDSEDDQSNWSSWKDAVDARDGQIIAAGHSLGGTAVVSRFDR